MATAPRDRVRVRDGARDRDRDGARDGARDRVRDRARDRAAHSESRAALRARGFKSASKSAQLETLETKQSHLEGETCLDPWVGGGGSTLPHVGSAPALPPPPRG